VLGIGRLQTDSIPYSVTNRQDAFVVALDARILNVRWLSVLASDRRYGEMFCEHAHAYPLMIPSHRAIFN